ncbi:MAG: hypothetical protein HUK28_04240, partial [Methanobrevibacter sp.]|nr:hypothetical protein [Methanobrevibacter sp.]
LEEFGSSEDVAIETDDSLEHKKNIKVKQKKPKNLVKKSIKNSDDELFEEAYDLFYQEDYYSSKEILNDILSRNQKHSDAYALLAVISYKQGDKPRAKVLAKKALSIDSANEMASELLFEL